MAIRTTLITSSPPALFQAQPTQFCKGATLTAARERQENGFYALAVSPGDIGIAAIPDLKPSRLAGLGLIGAMARRRKQAEVRVRQARK